jgi:segregation and condensation protein A
LSRFFDRRRVYARRVNSTAPASVSRLDLDLAIFQGPFDLLLAVLLREEISLAEVDLADVVLAYIDHLESVGSLDLESVTEFLVLIAALLELKSKLLLPGEEEELDELGPEEAADELLARMLEYRRYHDAAEALIEIRSAAEGYGYRVAAAPPELRRAALEAAEQAYEPDRLGQALETLLTPPPKVDASHIRQSVSLSRRVRILKDLLAAKSSFDFRETFGSEDHLTQAVTLFALLELHKRGEASWRQDRAFGPIEVIVS